ncbi:MAG: recombinase family protein [Clostridiales bacterium]|jgi:DNA invertase Pin-like site-specific DNA recombinase|nr:recombinase family protein [Clostridiales bacterium]
MEIAEMTTPKPRAVLLYRASTKKQTDSENDIPLQRNILKPWAENQGWEFKKELVEGGVSGFKVHAADRDALNEIKAMADRKEFDILGIYMSDRLGRIAAETPLVVEYLNTRGVKVISYTEGEITSATHQDKLLVYLKFWMAENESLKTAARCQDAIAQLIRQGKWTGGVPAYGYKRVLKGSVNFKGRPVYDIEIDPEQAEVVRLVYDLYLNKRYGMRMISNLLNEKGYRSVHGVKWNPVRVSAMLHLRNYTGVMVLHANGKKPRIESPFVESLRIIEQADWDAVQKLCDKNRTRVAPFGKSDNRATVHGRMLLTGLAYCGNCGRKLVGHYKYPSHEKGKPIDERDKAGGKFYYICQPSAEQFADGTRCKPALWACSRVDEMVVHDAKGFVRTIDKEKLLSDYSNAAGIRLAELASQRKKLEAEISKKDFEIRKLKDEVMRVIIGESAFSQNLLDDLIKTKESEYLALHNELKTVEASVKESEAAIAEKKAVTEKLVNWDEVFDGQDQKGKKGMLADFIRRAKPQEPIIGTHFVTRKEPYVKGRHGKTVQNAIRLGMPSDEAVVNFCAVPRSQSEIVELVGLAVAVVRQRHIDRLIEEGRLLITKPFAPRSMHQQFVNSDNPQYVRDDDAITEFCREPKTRKEIAEFIGLNRCTALSCLRTLTASGRLKHITGGGVEHGGNGSKYVGADYEG